MAIVCVSPKEAIAEWPSFSRRIDSVINRVDGGMCAEDVLTGVQLGNMQLWRDTENDAIAVTEIQCYPMHKVLLMTMVAGKHARKWFTAGQEHFDAFAKSKGCKYVEFTGRVGWERIARKHGFSQKFIRMRKEV